MRRVQFFSDDALYGALEADALRTRTSRAALIRACIAEKYRVAPMVSDDPLTSLLGISDDEPVNDIDAASTSDKDPGRSHWIGVDE